MTSVVVGLVVVISIALVACTPTPVGPPTDAFVRYCETDVGGPLEEGWEKKSVIVGPLAFYLATENADPSLASELQAVDGKYPAVQTLIIIEDDVTVAVPSHEWSDVSLLYDLSKSNVNNLYEVSDGDVAVRFMPCEFEPERPTQYNGGIIVAGPRCFDLDVFFADQVGPERVALSYAAGECG